MTSEVLRCCLNKSHNLSILFSEPFFGSNFEHLINVCIYFVNHPEVICYFAKSLVSQARSFKVPQRPPNVLYYLVMISQNNKLLIYFKMIRKVQRLIWMLEMIVDGLLILEPAGAETKILSNYCWIIQRDKTLIWMLKIIVDIGQTPFIGACWSGKWKQSFEKLSLFLINFNLRKY